jgi:hypothetical protein
VRNVRILLANEPRSYRESIAEALRYVCEGVEVRTTEPAELSRCIQQFTPDMIVCSEATAVVKSSAFIWVELYPGHDAHSSVSIGGRREDYAAIQLSDLISIVDQAKVHNP